MGTFARLMIVCLLLAACAPAQEGYTTEVVVEGLDTPWDIAFLPDGSMLITERGGTVRLFDGELATITELDVSEVSESGLLGIALHPEFEENDLVYLYYTTQTGNRVSRFTYDRTLIDEEVLLDNIPSARYHDGGRIRFGPDRMLYITTGDATQPSTAQNVSSLAGKILRMTPEGEIPADNPFGNYVYSYGHRNPQGFAWHDDQLYASEHGPNRHDEINRIERGGNYGWPETCGEQAEGTIDPVRCYTEFTLAPAGMDFYEGALYVAGLRGGHVRRIDLATMEEEALLSDLGRTRAIVAHDGWLYIATSNYDGRGVPRPGDDRIVRIRQET